MIRSLCLATVLTFATACASRTATETPRAAEPASVLLVSIDGLGAGQLDRGNTPALARMAREGVRAQWMTPSYPSLTFPNHYALVTGLLPDHQGIVHNTMEDAELGGFKPTDPEAVGDARWWGGEPIWVGAEKAGLRSATLYWPGSEAEIAGVRPTRWTEYVDGATLPPEQRVDTVLGWLSEPADTRPRLVTLYFESVDKLAHENGPESARAQAEIRTVDAAIGRLLRGLDDRGLRDRVDVVVVSDHGMVTVPRTQLLAVEDLVSKEEAKVVTVGQVVTLRPNPGYEAQVERRVLGAHDRFDCWRKGQLPPRWRYGTHPRIPPIVCQMHAGWDMLPRSVVAQRPAHDRGSHGYDPALPSMRAIFVARGPSFRTGARLQAFPNVDVYPLLAHLLGIPEAPNDGSLDALRPALRDGGVH